MSSEVAEQGITREQPAFPRSWQNATSQWNLPSWHGVFDWLAIQIAVYSKKDFSDNSEYYYFLHFPHLNCLYS